VTGTQQRSVLPFRPPRYRTTPYVVLMILLVVLLFVFPDLALWLPRHMAPAR